MKALFSRYQPDLETFLAALLGIALFTVLKLPTPVLSGAMVGVAGLLVLGRTVQFATPLRNLGMLISGVAMGSSVTPEMIQTMHRYPLSLLMLFSLVITGMWLSYAYFRFFGGWSRETAFFASVPGALSVVMATSAETKADPVKVVMAQSVRIFVLFAVVPSLVTLQGPLIELPVKAFLAPAPFVAVFAMAALLAILLVKVGLAAPWLFGGMLASAILHGSGLVVGDVHPWLTQIGFGLVGIMIGTRFIGIKSNDFLGLVKLSLGSVIIGLAVTLAGAFVAARLLTGIVFGQAVVAYAPGALEGMIVLGAALGLDPLFVGLHHLVRFFMIGLLLPVITPFISRADRRSGSDPGAVP